jgi:hypothetical protein
MEESKMDILQQMTKRIFLSAEPVHQVGDRFKLDGKEVIVSRIDKLHDEVIYGVSEIKGSRIKTAL